MKVQTYNLYKDIPENVYLLKEEQGITHIKISNGKGSVFISIEEFSPASKEAYRKLQYELEEKLMWGEPFKNYEDEKRKDLKGKMEP